MHALVYVIMALPMFLGIGLAMYCLLIERLQFTSFFVMLLCIFASLYVMENYYNNLEDKPVKVTQYICQSSSAAAIQLDCTKKD